VQKKYKDENKQSETFSIVEKTKKSKKMFLESYSFQNKF